MIQRLTKFGLVGILATISHYLVALFLSKLVGVLWANVIGYAGGMCVSYFGHRHLTFAASSGVVTRRAVTRFAATSSLAFLISQGILYVAIKTLQVPDWLALGLVVLTVPIFTFLLFQFWVFKPSSKEWGAT